MSCGDTSATEIITVNGYIYHLRDDLLPHSFHTAKYISQLVWHPKQTSLAKKICNKVGGESLFRHQETCSESNGDFFQKQNNRKEEIKKINQGKIGQEEGQTAEWSQRSVSALEGRGDYWRMSVGYNLLRRGDMWRRSEMVNLKERSGVHYLLAVLSMWNGPYLVSALLWCCVRLCRCDLHFLSDQNYSYKCIQILSNKMLFRHHRL